MTTIGQRKRTRAGAAVAALVAAVILLAGCASSGEPIDQSSTGNTEPSSQPSTGDDPTGGSSSPVSGTPDAVAYATCMRENGVPGFPDPNPDGDFAIDADTLGVPLDSEQYRQAEQTCAPLMPSLTADEQQAVYEAALEYAACMRENGIADMPDPPVPGDGPVTQSDSGGGQGGSINPSSPQFQAAHEACKQLLPDGGAGSSLSGQP